MASYNLLKGLNEELSIYNKNIAILDDNSKHSILEALKSPDTDSRKFVSDYLSSLDFFHEKNQAFISDLIENNLVMLCLVKQEDESYLIEIKNI